MESTQSPQKFFSPIPPHIGQPLSSFLRSSSFLGSSLFLWSSSEMINFVLTKATAQKNCEEFSQRHIGAIIMSLSHTTFCELGQCLLIIIETSVPHKKKPTETYTKVFIELLCN